jgi:hypothetical protein
MPLLSTTQATRTTEWTKHTVCGLQIPFVLKKLLSVNKERKTIYTKLEIFKPLCLKIQASRSMRLCWRLIYDPSRYTHHNLSKRSKSVARHGVLRQITWIHIHTSIREIRSGEGGKTCLSKVALFTTGRTGRISPIPTTMCTYRMRSSTSYCRETLPSTETNGRTHSVERYAYCPIQHPVRQGFLTSFCAMGPLEGLVKPKEPFSEKCI